MEIKFELLIWKSNKTQENKCERDIKCSRVFALLVTTSLNHAHANNMFQVLKLDSKFYVQVRELVRAIKT